MIKVKVTEIRTGTMEIDPKSYPIGWQTPDKILAYEESEFYEVPEYMDNLNDGTSAVMFEIIADSSEE